MARGHRSDIAVKGSGYKIRPWSLSIGCSPWRTSPTISMYRWPPSTRGDTDARDHRDSGSAGIYAFDGATSNAGSKTA